jgi:hypothetical protein
MFLDHIEPYGTVTKLDWSPPVQTLYNVAYIPRDSGVSSVGLYDHGRKLILSSLYCSSPDFRVPAENLILGHKYDEIREKIPGTHIYIGDIHPHYGHYLLSTMSRFWCKDLLQSNHPILYLDRAGGENNFNKPHISQTISALDVDRTRLVKFDKPCILEKVIVPSPAFEEGNFAHKIFGQMSRDIGDRIEDTDARSFSCRPIYFSKRMLKFGVRTFINEDEICEAFERNGFEVVFPETLSLGRQIALWRSGRVIATFTGSSLHTQIFASNPKICTINIGGLIPSSFLLCDWVSNSSSRYICADESSVEHHASTYDEAGQVGFSSLAILKNVDSIVDEVCRACDGQTHKIARVIV